MSKTKLYVVVVLVEYVSAWNKKEHHTMVRTVRIADAPSPHSAENFAVAWSLDGMMEGQKPCVSVLSTTSIYDTTPADVSVAYAHSRKHDFSARGTKHVSIVTASYSQLKVPRWYRNAQQQGLTRKCSSN